MKKLFLIPLAFYAGVGMGMPASKMMEIRQDFRYMISGLIEKSITEDELIGISSDILKACEANKFYFEFILQSILDEFETEREIQQCEERMLGILKAL